MLKKAFILHLLLLFCSGCNENKEMKNLYVQLGDSVRFKLLHEINQNFSEVKWKKDGTQAVAKIKSNHFCYPLYKTRCSILEIGSIKLNDIKEEDKGIYSAEVYEDAKCIHKESFHLHVQAPQVPVVVVLIASAVAGFLLIVVNGKVIVLSIRNKKRQEPQSQGSAVPEMRNNEPVTSGTDNDGLVYANMNKQKRKYSAPNENEKLPRQLDKKSDKIYAQVNKKYKGVGKTAYASIRIS